MLTIRLFGSPEIALDGRPVKLPRRKSRAILYYLAAQLYPVSREALLSVFWPDAPRQGAQQTLRTTLHELRQGLGPALIAEPELIALADDTQVDVRTFEKTLAHPPVELPELLGALDLYRGDFLADFSLPDVQAFEDWATIERERYRRLAVQGLVTLSSTYEAEQNYGAALGSLERALAFNPLQEDLQREMIRLVYLAGDRPGAIRRYDQLRRLLDEELGVPPMPETRALYDAIINERPLTPLSRRKAPSPRPSNPVPSPAASPARGRPAESPGNLPFTGRKAELIRMEELSRSHKLILIEGEPGIGKTRLAEEFIQTRNGLALTGRGRELEQPLPYHPITEALRTLVVRPDWPYLQAGLQASLPGVWLEEAGRLLPELAGSAPGGFTGGRTAEESRLWEGVSQFFHGLARLQPVILFLDDLHWADASTLALLGYLVRQSPSTPVTFLATSHAGQPRSPLFTLLQALLREDRLARLPLSSLSFEEVLEIANSLSPTASETLADWLQGSSEGNPYILSELVREARARQLLKPDGSFQLEGNSAEPLVPQTIYSLIQARLGRISEPARRLLDAAVAAGREFDFELVARASGLEEVAALDALDELTAAGLIQPVDSACFSFNHSLTMEVAYREVGELRHRMLHRQVAQALESLNQNQPEKVAALLAWHYLEGNDPVKAAPYAFQAGKQAANLAGWAEAIAFFEQALGGTNDERRLAIWIALGDALIKSGQSARASEVLLEALHWAQSKGEVDSLDKIRMELARSLLTQARFAEAIDLSRQVLEGGGQEYAEIAQLNWGAALSIEGSDLVGAEQHLKEAERLCSTHCGPGNSLASPEDLANLAHIKFELGSVLAQQGDLRQAVDFYRESLAAASSTDTDATVEQRILAYNNLAYHLHLLGDAGAEGYARAGLSLVEEKGIVGLRPYLLSTLGEIALARRDLDRAERYFTQGLEAAERLPIPERVAGLTANLGLVAIERGQTSLAIYRLSTALGKADALGTQHLAAQIRLWLAPLLPPDEARARLAEARGIADSSGRRRLLEEARQLEEKIIHQ